MTQIHNIIKNEKNDNIKYALEDLERNENDTMKMFKAVKKIKRLAPKEKLIIKTKEGLTSNEKKQSEIIAKYFKNIFYTNATPMQNVLLTPMSTLFTSSEIRKAVGTLKNNKSPGIGMDQINVELIKYSPEDVYEKIAAIYNDIAATGKHPNEITHGILRALQKPGKPNVPTSILRPIILLSVLRKILAVCIMKRINSRLDSAIPMSQSAYRKNRSTTEHVFATKLIIERTISSTDETVCLLLLDMSKSFDSIQRNTLIEDLKNVLNYDELHLILILFDVKIAAQCGNYKSRFFSTDAGAPQADWASASEFTFYLAK